MEDKYINLSQTQKDALLDAQRASGQTVRAFCAERGIKESRFYSWRARQRQADREGATRPGFVAVRPQAASLRVRLSGGLELHLDPSQLDLAAELLLKMDRRRAEF